MRSDKVVDKFINDMENGYNHVRKYAKGVCWYPSLNQGIPITIKANNMNTAVYVFHDLVHTILYDPLPSASMPDYVIGKTCGEICSHYFTDYMYVEELRKSISSYDFEQCRPFNSFVTSIKSYNGASDYGIMRAVCDYVILGNETPLKSLVDNCTQKEQDYYISEYRPYTCNMCIADLWWNYQVHKQFDVVQPYIGVIPINNIEQSGIDSIINRNIFLIDNVEHHHELYNNIDVCKHFHRDNKRLFDFVPCSYNKIYDVSEIRKEIKDHA